MSDGKYFLRQCLAAFACFIESIGCGVVMAFTGTLFPQLQTDPQFGLTKNQEAWIASSAILSMACGCILGGLFLPRFTRKFLIITTNLVMILGFLFLYFSENYTLLLSGRILCGLSMGISRPAIITTVAEMSPPQLRTTFSNLIMLGHVVGALLSDIAATFLNWRCNSLLTCLYPGMAVVIFLFLPEVYGSHLGKKKYQSAIESFHWYRGYDHTSRLEIEEIIRFEKDTSIASDINEHLRIVDKKFLRSFFICTTFFAAGQLNGVNVLSLYSVQIFQGIFQGINGSYITIGYDSIKILTSLTSFYFIKRLKFRFLTFLSAVGVVLTLTSLSIFHYVQNSTVHKINTTSYNILTCFVIILYVQFLLLGLAPLSWATPPELFKREAVGVGSGGTIFLNYIIYFLVVKYSPALLDVSYSLTFGVFALCTAVLACILWFILPETKDKTLLEVQASVNLR